MSRGFLNYFLNIVRIENTIVIVLAINTITIVVVLIVFTSLSFTIIIITQIQEFVKLSDCTNFVANFCATCTSRKPRPAPSSTAPSSDVLWGVGLGLEAFPGKTPDIPFVFFSDRNE